VWHHLHLLQGTIFGRAENPDRLYKSDFKDTELTWWFDRSST